MPPLSPSVARTDLTALVLRVWTLRDETAQLDRPDLASVGSLGAAFAFWPETVFRAATAAAPAEPPKAGKAKGGGKAAVPTSLLPPPPARAVEVWACLLYTSPSPRDRQKSRMPSSA